MSAALPRLRPRAVRRRGRWGLVALASIAACRPDAPFIGFGAQDPIDPLIASTPADSTLKLHALSARLEITAVWGDDHDVMPSAITAIALSSDGSTVAIASERRLFTRRRGRPARRWRRLPAPVVSLVLSFDGRRVAARTEDGDIIVWARGSEAHVTLDRGVDGMDERGRLAFTSDGRQLIAGRRVWDPDSGRVVPSGIHGRSIIDISPDGTTALTARLGPASSRADDDEVPLLRGRASGHWARQRYGTGQLVDRLPFDGRIIAAALSDEHVIALRQQAHWAEILDEQGQWLTLPLSFDGRFVVADQGSVCGLLDARGHAAILDMQARRQRWFGALDPQFDPSGRWVLTRHRKGVTVRDVQDGAVVFQRPEEDDFLYSNYAHPYAAASSASLVAYVPTPFAAVVTTIADEPIMPANAHRGPVTAVAIAPDEQRVVSMTYDGGALLWGPDHEVLPLVGLETRAHGPDAHHDDLRFHPDGREVLGVSDLAGDTWLARAWDTTDGRELMSLGGRSGTLANDGSLVFHDPPFSDGWWRYLRPEGALELVSPDRRRTNKPLFSLWGAVLVDDRQRYFTAIVREPEVHGVRYRRTVDGRLLAAADLRHPVASLAAPPRGRYLAIGDELGNLYVWDPTMTVAPRSWRAHDGRVRALAAHETEDWLISASIDGRARLWSLDGTLLAELDLSARPDEPTAVALLGSSVAVGTARGLVIRGRLGD